jgi:hypothetical protein
MMDFLQYYLPYVAGYVIGSVITYFIMRQK